MTVDAFDCGEYYDCKESDTLTHRSAEEAVEDWVESWMERDGDVSEVIREHAPCEITAYQTEVIGENWIRGLAESLLEYAEERLVENFGDPNDYDKECIAPEDLKACLPAMIEMVRQVASHFQVRRCEPVATRTLTAEQVETMMREFNPGWFKAPAEPNTPSEKPA